MHTSHCKAECESILMGVRILSPASHQYEAKRLSIIVGKQTCLRT